MTFTHREYNYYDLSYTLTKITNTPSPGFEKTDYPIPCVHNQGYNLVREDIPIETVQTAQVDSIRIILLKNDDMH